MLLLTILLPRKAACANDTKSMSVEICIVVFCERSVSQSHLNNIHLFPGLARMTARGVGVPVASAQRPSPFISVESGILNQVSI